MKAVHPCPWCLCGREPAVKVNEAAPFYPLVLLIDQLVYGRRAR